MFVLWLYFHGQRFVRQNQNFQQTKKRKEKEKVCDIDTVETLRHVELMVLSSFHGGTWCGKEIAKMYPPMDDKR